MFPVRILSAAAVTDYRLVILYDDETVQIWRFPFPCRSEVGHPLRDPALFAQVEVSPDGFQVSWPSGYHYDAAELYDSGNLLPLSMRDLAMLCRENILSTSEVASLLGCTRQNVDSLAVRGKLSPLKSYKRNRLFLRGDVIRRKWWNTDALPSAPVLERCIETLHSYVTQKEQNV